LNIPGTTGLQNSTKSGFGRRRPDWPSHTPEDADPARRGARSTDMGWKWEPDPCTRSDPDAV